MSHPETFKFTLVSDLHEDAGWNYNFMDLPMEDSIIVAGDTTNNVLKSRDLIRDITNTHKRVYAVDGNHEHYHNARQGWTLEDSYERWEPLAVVHWAEDTTVVGTNGWYDPYIDDYMTMTWRSNMNDFSRFGDIHGYAETEAQYMDHIIEEAPGKVICVTHTAPVPSVLKIKAHDEFWNYMNAFYHNRYMGDVLRRHADKILVWCHGHTHFAVDQVVEGVRIVANPRGYPGENPNWQPLTVEVSL